MNAQRQVGQFLERRGYTSKKPNAHLTKAGLKMLEEVCEFVLLLSIPVELHVQVSLMEKMAKKAFDQAVAEGDKYDPFVDEWSLDEMRTELSDVAVTLFDTSNALGRLEDDAPFDVVAAAVEKATADVKRGVRE